MKLHFTHLNYWGDCTCSSDKGKDLKSLDTYETWTHGQTEKKWFWILNISKYLSKKFQKLIIKWPKCLEIEMVHLSADTDQQIGQTTNFWN
jgi:hypothetical protein